MRNATCAIAVLFCLLFPSIVFAEPCVDNATQFANTGSIIEVYLEHDFAEEMSDTSSSNLDDNYLDESHTQGVIIRALERWNQESGSNYFRYKGVFSDDSTFSCPGQGENRLYIHFQPECADSNPAGGIEGTGDGQESCSSDSDCQAGATCEDNLCPALGCASSEPIAQFIELDACPSRGARIVVFGNPRNDDRNATFGTGRDFRMVAKHFEGTGTSEGSTDLEAMMVHELGHALSLGHPTNPSTKSTMSVGVDRFLREWDQDCADEFQTGRNLIPWTRGISSTGVIRPAAELDTATGPWTKAGISNSVWRSGLTERAVYGAGSDASFDGSSYTDGVGTNGYFSFSQTANDWSPNPVYTNPTFFAAGKDLGSWWVDQIVSYTWPFDGNSVVYPPLVKGIASDNFFQNRTVFSYEQCDSASCNSMSPIQSSVPMSYAYDPLADENIYVTVDTSANGVQNTGVGGEIRIHPGNYNHTRAHLKVGTRLSNASQSTGIFYEAGITNLPMDGPYRARGLTDSAVGVACANQTVVADFNCILVWTDRGLPDPKVLYTFFSVDPKNSTVDFYDATFYLPHGAKSVSHLSAAYVAGRFWVGYKSHITNYGYVSRAVVSSPFSWTSFSLGVTVADPPSFSYDSAASSEAAFFWTEPQ